MAVYNRARKLANAIQAVAGKSAAKEILAGLTLPSAGTTYRSKARWTRQVIGRMDRLLPTARQREIRRCCSCRVTDKMVRRHRRYWQSAAGDLAAYAEQVRGGGWKSMTYVGPRTLQYAYDFPRCICGLARGADQPISGVVQTRVTLSRARQEVSSCITDFEGICYVSGAASANWVKCYRRVGQAEPRPICHTFCLCSAGHCDRFFEAVFEVPAEVTILTTRLRDDAPCTFRVRFAKQHKP